MSLPSTPPGRLRRTRDRRTGVSLLVVGGVAAAATVFGLAGGSATASSHREAPTAR